MNEPTSPKRRPLKRRILITMGALAAFGLVGYGLVAYALIEPQTSFGYLVFRAWYGASSSKGNMLQAYTAILETGNGSYIPDAQDRFLCNRLEATSSASERTAIAKFYAAHTYGRVGSYIYAVNDGTKEKVIGLLFGNLSTIEPSEAEDRLLLIEYMRRGEDLGKAAIVDRAYAGPDYQTWRHKKTVPTASAHFNAWWKVSEPWETKRKRNPLEGSALSIQGI